MSILEILVYLQKQVSPIIHRDIKPENILVDEELNAYLVDFGLARIQGAKVALSSFIAGTLISYQPNNTVRQLSEARECQSFDLNASCQENTRH